MTDIVERLRALAEANTWRTKTERELWNGLDEAATEIERLRGLSPDNMPKNETEWWIALKDQNREIERLREALRNITIGGNGEHNWSTYEMRAYAEDALRP